MGVVFAKEHSWTITLSSLLAVASGLSLAPLPLPGDQERQTKMYLIPPVVATHATPLARRGIKRKLRALQMPGHTRSLTRLMIWASV